MKLICDWWNGGKWQWKYFDPQVGRWFDYGPAFSTYQYAERWIEDRDA